MPASTGNRGIIRRRSRGGKAAGRPTEGNTRLTSRQSAGIGWNRLELAGIGWNWLELAGIGWNWLELAGIGWKLAGNWLEIGWKLLLKYRWPDYRYFGRDS
jgi:hypothetical protein